MLLWAILLPLIHRADLITSSETGQLNNGHVGDSQSRDMTRDSCLS